MINALSIYIYNTKLSNNYQLLNTPIPSHFLCLLVPIQTQEVPRLLTVKTAIPGDTVTLHCAAKENDDKFHWYKQAPGYIPVTVAARVLDTITIYPPFNLTFIVEGVSDFSLRISNITKDDEANYFCRQRFFDSWINGTFLTVKGKLSCFQCFWFFEPNKPKKYIDHLLFNCADLNDQRLDIRGQYILLPTSSLLESGTCVCSATEI